MYRSLIIVALILGSCTQSAEKSGKAPKSDSKISEPDEAMNTDSAAIELDSIPVELEPEPVPPPPPEDWPPPPDIEIEEIEPEPEPIFIDFPSVEAEFPGGQEYLERFIVENVRYPMLAKEMELTGSVLVQYEVGKDGAISKVKVIQGVHDILDQEAIRVVKRMPKWIPAEEHGKKIAVTKNIPIVFRLE